MPDLSAVGEALLPSTIFLYPSPEDAQAGKRYGGSGVVIGMPHEERPDLYALYAVTNWHVACAGGNSIIRYESAEGKTCFIETDPAEWEFIPGGPDLAACRFFAEPGQRPHFITDSILPEDDGEFFLGEDVFMVGRFLDFDGTDTNRPALRFGAVSMLNAPVRQPTGSMSPSHIVDMHSRTGYSGSPVYAYRAQGVVRGGYNKGMTFGNGAPAVSRRTWGDGTQMLVKLLGLQWGQFPEMWELKDGPKRPEAEAALITEGKYVAGFSGMSCVIPARQIRSLLDRAPLKMARQESIHRYVTIPLPENPFGRAD